MKKYALQRTIGMIPTVLLMVFIIVVMMRLMPGDVVDVLLAEQASDPGARADLERRLGIDKSIPEAYVRYLVDLAQGDMGQSLHTGAAVGTMLARPLLVTMELAVVAAVIGLFIGISIGIVSALRQDTLVDYALRSFAIAGLSVPNFALATAIVVLPAIYFQWTPPITFTAISDDPVAHFQQYLLPGAVLGLGLAGSLMRLTRTQVLEVLRQDYVRTARVKGLPERSVVFGHVMRNALIPVITVFGLQIATLLSGAVIVESIFSLPGLGRLLLDAIRARDYPVVQGLMVLIGVFVVAVNLVVDLSYGWIDPRVRAQYG